MERDPITFDGWGMTTTHALPWDDAHRWASLRASLEAMHGFDMGDETLGMVSGNIGILSWRHWVVAFAVRYAASFAARARLIGAECGVGEGMSAFIALRELADIAANRRRFQYRLHLYDAFAPMRSENLRESEQWQVGQYRSVSLERTRSNLRGFTDRTVWHVGHVPESFDAGPRGPRRVHYLHIDINSAAATLDACRYFLPRLHARAAVLLDDYGHMHYSDTKQVVDDFFADVPGQLLKFPTGQAMFLHDGR
jgi:hypothetical protein